MLGLLRFSKFTRQTSLKGNIVANYLGKGWEAAMGLAFVPVYISYLGPEAFGIVGLVAMIQAFMGILDFGMTPTLTREAARFSAGAFSVIGMRDLIRSVEFITFAISAAIIAVIALSSPLIASYWLQADLLSNDSISTAFAIAAAVIAMRFFETIYRGTLYGLQRQVLCSVITAVMATLRGGGAVLLLVWFDVGLEDFFAWQALVSGLTIIALASSVYIILPEGGRGGRFSLKVLSSVWRFATGMLVISLLSILVTQGDKVFLSYLVSLKDFGYYVFAAKIASILGIASAPMLSALYPQLVGYVSQGNEAQLTAKFHRFAKIVVCITAPAAAVMSVFAESIIFVWSGDATLAASAAPLLSIIVLGTFLHMQCVLPYNVQLAYGWTSLAVWTNTFAMILLVSSIFFAVPRYGTAGAAWVWVMVASLYFFVSINIMFFRYLSKERILFYFGDVGLPAAVSFITAFCSYEIMADFLQDRITMFFCVLGALVLSFILAIGSSFLLKNKCFFLNVEKN